MFSLRTDIPIKKDAVDEAGVVISQIRDKLTELEALLRTATQERAFFTKKEVQELIRSQTIPSSIPRIRRGLDTIFEKSDVYNYLDSKKR